MALTYEAHLAARLEPQQASESDLVSVVVSTLLPAVRRYTLESPQSDYQEATAESWSRFDWTQFETETPKPSFAEAMRIRERDWRLRLARYATTLAIRAAANYFDLQPIDHSLSKAVHTGAGLDRMPAAIQLMDASARAGAHHPKMVMRNAGDEEVDLWTEEHKAELVGALAHRTNVVESAKNILRAKYRMLGGKMREWPEGVPTDAELEETRPLRDKLIAMLQPGALEKEFRDTMAAVSDEAALPADLATLREILTERIEAAAMKRVKEIKGAKTQQGVDVPATCLDMASALEEVSQKCALGVQAVDDAADVAAAKAAFNAAKVKIEAVTPLNVPEWESDEATDAGHVVTVKAKHPAEQAIAGRVTLTVWGGADGDGKSLFLAPRVTRPGGGAAVIWQAKLPSGVVYPVKLRFAARNLCGPSNFALQVEDPSP